MRHSLIAITTLALAFGCGGESNNDDEGAPDPIEEPDAGTGGTGSVAYELGEPVVVTPGQAAITGVTSDGYAIFRDSSGLKAVLLEEGAEPELITESAGIVQVRNNAVLVWRNPDYTTNLGELALWTAGGGLQPVGTTLLADDLVQVSDDGHVLYTLNLATDRFDLIVDNIDLSSSQVAIEAMGRGDDETCRANYRFVGPTAFVAFCMPGSREAQIVRLDPAADGGAWTLTELVSGAQPLWSADDSGNRLFYTTTGSQAFVLDGGTSYEIDASVGWGMLLPDGSAVLYTVGDQLRRTAFPDVAPLPVVTRDFRQRTALSEDNRWALFSTVIDYSNGQTQDLRLTSTDGFSEAPTVIVDSAAATMSRAAFSENGEWVLYMTDVTPPVGGTLHAFNVSTGVERTFENAHDVIAASGDVIVFTDNHSPVDQYPPIADLKIVDLASDQEPVLVDERVLDGKSHFLSEDKTTLVYTRSGVNPDLTVNAEAQAVITRSLR